MMFTESIVVFSDQLYQLQQSPQPTAISRLCRQTPVCHHQDCPTTPHPPPSHPQACLDSFLHHPWLVSNFLTSMILN